MPTLTTQYDLIERNKRLSALVIIIFIAIIMGVTYLLYLAEITPLSFMAGAFIFSALWSLGSYFFSDKVILSFAGAKKANKTDHYDLYTVTENLTMGAGLPMPGLYVIEDSALNAFATGRNPQHAVVAVTSGLLTKLDRHELEAVIGHELSHVRHYDILLSSLVAVLAGALVMVIDLSLRSGRRRSNSSSSRHSSGGGIIIIIAYLAAILAPIILSLLQLALSRRREFLADAGSVELTRNPEAMIKALKKISRDPQPLARASQATAEFYITDPYKKSTLGKKVAGLFATHPPIEARIAALEKLIS